MTADHKMPTRQTPGGYDGKTLKGTSRPVLLGFSALFRREAACFFLAARLVIPAIAFLLRAPRVHKPSRPSKYQDHLEGKTACRGPDDVLARTRRRLLAHRGTYWRTKAAQHRTSESGRKCAGSGDYRERLSLTKGMHNSPEKPEIADVFTHGLKLKGHHGQDTQAENNLFRCPTSDAAPNDERTNPALSAASTDRAA